jgi:sphingolipid C9-methyltransferase
METFYELYFDDKLELQDGYDILDLLEMRHDWASFQFTWGHVRFMFQNFVKEVSVHSRAQDEEQVRDHYDRGNDFYEAFLGPIMIYTSGIIGDASRRETLEEMQTNKLDLVCNKIQLKSDEKLLDIGCGWGTLIAHAAKNYGAKATGVTLAREQTEFGLNRAKEYGVEDKVNILCKDYRDIPKPSAPNGQLYDKITCLEMAEHVGVFKFNNFLLQVSELLKDDGLFYLQIAGLRRPWQYEDLQWGLFMNKYVFPGADASCPLAWVIGQLEYAGFEVQSVDTIGVHYSATLERWYQNWLKPENKQLMQERYGKRLWKVWEFFLAWSVVASRQGSATCYQIVCHKNSNTFDRVSFLEGYGQRRLKVQQ